MDVRTANPLFLARLANPCFKADEWFAVSPDISDIVSPLGFNTPAVRAVFCAGTLFWVWCLGVKREIFRHFGGHRAAGGFWFVYIGFGSQEITPGQIDGYAYLSKKFIEKQQAGD
jgi:hypothetical protein